ncbi:MAG: rhomboid family intramembrane serine protease [Coriobacteriia bacterium]|nr:rhomboid family intramembrane serine protease [Coriobacteriia bacterium]
MIPLRDENPTRRFPWVTVALIAANVAMFAYQVSLGPGIVEFVTRWAFVPARFFGAPWDPRQWLTVFAAMFMHAGLLHIGGNMLYLWIFGNNVEDRLGRPRFIGFYLLAGVAATLAQGLVDTGSVIPNLGASGAVAGVLGGYLLLYPGAAVLTVIPIFFFIEVARVPAAFVIGFWFVLQLANGLIALAPGTAQVGGVAWFAHLGGFAAGALMMLPVWLSQRRRTGFRAYG